MYFARLRINPHRRESARLIGSRQRTHAAVLSAFPDEQGGRGGEGRPLWRLDRGPFSTDLLVVSGHRPDLRHIEERCCWEDDTANGVKEYAPFLDHIENGQKYMFRLVANPMRSVRDHPGDANTVRRPCKTLDQQHRWFVDRLPVIGLSMEDPVHSLAISEISEVPIKKGQSLRPLQMATYEGIGTVIDASALRQALTAGVGRAKAHGCGLLTLARAE